MRRWENDGLCVEIKGGKMTRWVHGSMILNHGREIDGEEQKHKKEWRWQNT